MRLGDAQQPTPTSLEPQASSAGAPDAGAAAAP